MNKRRKREIVVAMSILVGFIILMAILSRLA
jgi:hypothetical protein